LRASLEGENAVLILDGPLLPVDSELPDPLFNRPKLQAVKSNDPIVSKAVLHLN
jgi:hypothetical protein